MHTIFWVPLFWVALLGPTAADQFEEDCSECQSSFLQAELRTIEKTISGPKQHYWPHARGQVGKYSQTSYGIDTERLSETNLTASLAWKWSHAKNLSTSIWGTLIDKDKNIIIVSSTGLYKYTADGESLWNRTDLMGSQMPVIMGQQLFTMQMMSAIMHAIDLDSGEDVWVKKVGPGTGMEGDMVEANNGVIVAAVEMFGLPDPIGTPARRAIGVNASTGDELWSYTPDCGIWNIMALFPDDDTVNFMDMCGGVYRLGLFNGSELWKHTGSLFSMTDGGATLGPDGSMYTCSNGPFTVAGMNELGSNAGRARKYRGSDGALLWEVELPNACMNFPSISPDGETMVLADGANVIFAPTKDLKGQNKSQTEIDEFYAFQQSLLANRSQLAYYGKDDLMASISGFDTHTGELKWQHDVEPWYGMAFALDEERAYNWVSGKSDSPHCGPPHWSSATIDQSGKVYISRSTGETYIYDPVTDAQTMFHHGDGVMMAGISFAPGLMVVPTCSFVYVFHT
eukprot:gb/GFBE01071305.1/.p1 GENE.gb/GFBE01071305.1/~~gb/GFBE01071305.1/.p1  ORF type:complete len:512 (+),score=94.08 gb/GFBE01071305.1/:1-1536(+)